MVASGPLAIALDVAAWCYSNRYLTSGFVPYAAARGLLSWDGINLNGKPVTAQRVIDLLVKVGRWHDCPDLQGYQIHDFQQYNRDAEAVRAEREHLRQVRAEAGRRGAESRWRGHQSDGKPHGKANGKTMAQPLANGWQTDGPIPNPIPESESAESTDSGIRARGPNRGAESRLSADAESGPISQSKSKNRLRDWRLQTEKLAIESARAVGDDERSLGYHIRVWNHARQQDRVSGGAGFVDALFTVLHQLEDEARTSGQARQGKAWTRRTRKLFRDMGAPMESGGAVADSEDQEAIASFREHMKQTAPGVEE